MCDKCKKTFSIDEMTCDIKITGMYSEDINLDLCDKCKDKLDDFMDRK